MARTVRTAIGANRGGKQKLYGPENVFDRLMILVSDISAMHLDGKQHDAPTFTFTKIHNENCPFRLCSVWPSVRFYWCCRQRVANVSNEGHTQNNFLYYLQVQKVFLVLQLQPLMPFLWPLLLLHLIKSLAIIDKWQIVCINASIVCGINC